MIDLEGTHLVAATEAEHTLLSNLLELYIHDLSALFPQVRLGPDGRFGYPDPVAPPCSKKVCSTLSCRKGSLGRNALARKLGGPSGAAHSWRAIRSACLRARQGAAPRSR